MGTTNGAWIKTWQAINLGFSLGLVSSVLNQLGLMLSSVLKLSHDSIPSGLVYKKH